jgi:hypothetical protein
MSVSVNVNHYVKVKLNDIGIKELERQHKQLEAEYPMLGGFKKPNVDENGYSTFQLHDLMRKFGHMMRIGFDCPFDMDVIFEEYKEFDSE